MELGLEGKVAAVGGASRGIGRAIALALSREGCKVAICARGTEQLLRTQKEIRNETRNDVLASPCDMAREDDVRRFIERTAETFGRLDILVNNAGGPPLGTFDQQSEETWRLALDQNLLSVVRATREALPYMRQAGGGRIINILSVSVKQPLDNLILSNAARLGVVGLAKTLSKELGPDGITVNNVCPGSTLTDRIRPVLEARAQAEGRPLDAVLEEEARRIPTRRMGQPEDIAALVVFLASDPARQITGTTIQVDGGATAAVM